MAEAGMQRARKLQLARGWRVRWAIAAGVSLLACAVSCFVAPGVGFAGRAQVNLHAASLDVAYYNEPVPDARGVSLTRVPLAPVWFPSFERLTHELITHSQRKTIRVTGLILPLWPLPLLCGGMAAWHHRRVRRLSRTGCQSCGYDTRGLAASMCPECGAVRSV